MHTEPRAARLSLLASRSPRPGDRCRYHAQGGANFPPSIHSVLTRIFWQGTNLDLSRIISRDIAVTVALTVVLFLCTSFDSSTYGPIDIFAILFSGPFAFLAIMLGFVFRLAAFGAPHLESPPLETTSLLMLAVLIRIASVVCISQFICNLKNCVLPLGRTSLAVSVLFSLLSFLFGAWYLISCQQ